MYSLLLVLTLLPSISSIVNCRTACQNCRAKTEPPSFLEVYCAMCEECKERRRERLKEKVKTMEKSKEKVEMAPPPPPPYNPGYLGYPGYMPPMPVMPMMPPMYAPVARGVPMDGCPAPPWCEESEEIVAKYRLQLETSTTPTTNTTTPTPEPTTTVTTTTTTEPTPTPTPTTMTTRASTNRRRYPAFPPCRNGIILAPHPMVPVYQSFINVPMMPCPFSGGGPIAEAEDRGPRPDTPAETTKPTTNVEDTFSPVFLDRRSRQMLRNTQTYKSTTDKDFAYIYIGVPTNMMKSR